MFSIVTETQLALDGNYDRVSCLKHVGTEGYYGQLERQNREHRDWLAWCERTSDDMQTELDRMKIALNERWLRRTLGWKSAAELWQRRRSFDDERGSFLDEIDEHAARLRGHGIEQRLAMRLAIEQALTQKGYLQVTLGRQTLCE